MDNQQSCVEQGNEVDNEINERRQWNPKIDSSGKGTTNSLSHEDDEDHVPMPNLPNTSDLDNNRPQSKEDSTHTTGKTVPTVDYLLDKNSEQERRLEVEIGPNYKAPATNSTVNTQRSGSAQRHVKRIFKITRVPMDNQQSCKEKGRGPDNEVNKRRQRNSNIDSSSNGTTNSLSYEFDEDNVFQPSFQSTLELNNNRPQNKEDLAHNKGEIVSTIEFQLDENTEQKRCPEVEMPRAPVNNQQSCIENGQKIDNAVNQRRPRNKDIYPITNRIANSRSRQNDQDNVSQLNLRNTFELDNRRRRKNPTHTIIETATVCDSQQHGDTKQKAEKDPNFSSQEIVSTVVNTPSGGTEQNFVKRLFQSVWTKLVRLILYLIGPVPERQRWNSTFDSIMGLLAETVGLGNIWAFPIYCSKYGGWNYLIAYGVALLVIGFPKCVMDISIAQYLSFGPTNTFASMSPLFSGLGWAMVASNALVSIYYTVVLGWTLTYMYMSLTPDYPFAEIRIFKPQ